MTHSVATEVAMVLRAAWAPPLTPLTTCHYCGMPASSTDHVVPQSLLDSIKGEPELLRQLVSRRRTMTVPACLECNDLAGGTFQPTLAERTALVKSRLRKRYAAVLRTPDWSEAELKQLRPRLRKRVLTALETKLLIQERLAYPRT